MGWPIDLSPDRACRAVWLSKNTDNPCPDRCICLHGLTGVASSVTERRTETV